MKKIDFGTIKSRLSKSRLSKKWIIITATVLVVAVVFLIIRGSFMNKKMTSAPMSQAPVTRRDIVATITGTAVVQPKDQYSVTSLVAGEILSANFEEGDYVEKDDILYSIDASDIQKDIKSARLAVEKAQQNYNDAIKSKDENAKTNQSNLESAQLAVDKARQNYDDAVKSKDENARTNQSNLESAQLAVDKAQQGYDDAVKSKNENAKTNQSNLESAKLAVEKAQQNYNDAVKSKNKNAVTNKSNLESAKLAVEKAQRSYNDAEKNIKNLKVNSDISGTVGEIYVKEGDNVSTGMNIAHIYDDSSLRVKIPFNEDDAMKLNIGQSAKITIVGSGETLTGSVSDINTASEIKGGYMKVRYVTIKVNSPGALSPSDKATASIGDIHCNDVGVFEYLSEKTITAKASGTVDKINIDEGNKISAGETLITLTSDSAETQLESAAISVKDAKLAYDKAQEAMDDFSSDSQIKNAELALKDAKLAYNKALEAMDDYTSESQVKNAELALEDAHLSYGKVQDAMDDFTSESQVKSAEIALDDAKISYGKVHNALDDYSSDSQIKNAALALEDARINLEKLMEAGDDYKITAPISGQVITKNAKAGDKIDNTNSQEAMAVIYDMSSLEFELMIDELDINKVSVGHKVKITADALDGREYTGYVAKVSIDGTESNGVTSYPVSVVIEDFDDNLLPGMNIDAEIEVGSVSDVLTVPKSAVTRDNIVYVAGEKEDVTDRAPEGYKSVQVETGLNDGNYIEIISGLSEGDKVKIESTNSTNMMPMGMPMGGMHGGGMPR